MARITLLNNQIGYMEDDKLNGKFYELENEDTGVIYRALNIVENKTYIGQAYSYEKHGKKPATRYGARGRFKRHWSNKSNPRAYNECPKFYEALRRSKINDWLIFTIYVGSKKKLKEKETKFIQEFKTANPKFGYNKFVNNKPEDPIYREEYQIRKAKSNVDRAANGAMKRTANSKGIPANIYSRKTGYVVQIKINGKMYFKAFLSLQDSMEHKLEQAIRQLAKFKKQANQRAHSK